MKCPHFGAPINSCTGSNYITTIPALLLFTFMNGQMYAVANYTLEVRNNLVGTTINNTLQEFMEIRVRT